MKIQPNSLTFIVIGAWSKYYLEPMWLGSNVLNSDKVNVEFGFTPTGGMGITIRNEVCSIQPGAGRFAFTCLNYSQEGIAEFEKVCFAFIKAVHTPIIEAYGLNISFTDKDTTSFALIIDELPDVDNFALAGAEIKNTSFTREVEYENMTLNIKYSIIIDDFVISVNQHVPCNKSSDEVKPPEDFVRSFRDKTTLLLEKIGYEFDEDELNERLD